MHVQYIPLAFFRYTKYRPHIGELIAIWVCFRLVKSPNLVQHWYRWYH